MKAYLKSSEGTYYPLAPKVTTVGKDGCDILLQVHSVVHVELLTGMVV